MSISEGALKVEPSGMFAISTYAGRAKTARLPPTARPFGPEEGNCWFEYTGSPPGDHGTGVGYFNGISAHAAQNWIIRGNLFKNLHNPDGTAYDWNPAVLFWRHSVNTITEQNAFVNVDRAIAFGLDNSTPFPEHAT